MANNLWDALCPTDCTAPILLALEADQDCAGCDPKLSQICGIYFDAETSIPIGTWDSSGVTTWATTNVDNTHTIDNTKVKYLVGEGGIDASEKSIVELPKNRTKTGTRTFTMVFDVKCLTDTHYEFGRALQCGYTGNIWFETNGGWFFGHLDGIEVSNLDVDFIYGSGREDYETMRITISWIADVDPPRLANPL